MSPNLTFLLEITDAVSSGLKSRETFQRVISIQFKSSISYGMGVHKCIRYGQLACFGRHYECWKIYNGFRATYAPLQIMVFLQDNVKPHTAAITTAWLRSRRCWICLPTVQICTFYFLAHFTPYFFLLFFYSYLYLYILSCVIFHFFCTVHWANLSGFTFHYWLYSV